MYSLYFVYSLLDYFYEFRSYSDEYPCNSIERGIVYACPSLFHAYLPQLRGSKLMKKRIIPPIKKYPPHNSFFEKWQSENLTGRSADIAIKYSKRSVRNRMFAKVKICSEICNEGGKEGSPNFNRVPKISRKYLKFSKLCGVNNHTTFPFTRAKKILHEDKVNDF